MPFTLAVAMRREVTIAQGSARARLAETHAVPILAAMGTLSYGMIMSLDGFAKGPDGRFGWGEPDEATHQLVNDREREFGTYLYGRHLFDTMKVWAQEDWLEGEPEVVQEYARIWRGRDKIVYSTSMAPPTLERTRLERTLDLDAVRDLKESSDEGICVGGPTLAAQLLRAGLVDELTMYIAPVVVGGGAPALPGVSLHLDLLEERRLGGFVYLRHAVRNT